MVYVIPEIARILGPCELVSNSAYDQPLTSAPRCLITRHGNKGTKRFGGGPCLSARRTISDGINRDCPGAGMAYRSQSCATNAGTILGRQFDNRLVCVGPRALVRNPYSSEWSERKSMETHPANHPHRPIPDLTKSNVSADGSRVFRLRGPPLERLDRDARSYLCLGTSAICNLA